MPDNRIHRQPRIGAQQPAQGTREPEVLFCRIGPGIRTFKLNTNRERVAATAPPPTGNASVPGTQVKGHKLAQPTASIDKQVRRHLYPSEISQLRIAAAVKSVAKQRLNHAGAKFAGWQRNVVQNHKFHPSTRRTGIAIRTRNSVGAWQPARVGRDGRDLKKTSGQKLGRPVTKGASSPVCGYHSKTRSLNSRLRSLPKCLTTLTSMPLI